MNYALILSSSQVVVANFNAAYVAPNGHTYVPCLLGGDWHPVRFTNLKETKGNEFSILKLVF